jgi:hypothetical protein
VADPITDEHVAAVLRTFVRASRPMLARLRQDDDEVAEEIAEEIEVAEGPPACDEESERTRRARIKDRLRQLRYPGSEAWAKLTPEEHVDWWVNRVGRFTSLAASVTGLAGAIGDRLPLQDMLGSASQGLLLCAIASEFGVDDRGTRVRLLASVLFERDIDPVVAAGKGDAAADAADEAIVAELTDEQVEPVDAEPGGRKFGIKAAATWLWRQGRMLFAISDELEKRPQGRFYHRALGKVPVVGMAGDYFGERSALKRAARAGQKWLRANATSRI